MPMKIRRAPKKLRPRDDGCYLIVGGLRGLCGSLAMYLAKIGAKHLAIMSRSGYEDVKSRGILKQIKALGAHIDLLTADVTIMGDVEKALRQTAVPVVGIIQGAMVLRDRPFDSMTLAEYHDTVQCKIQGTWNLHNAAGMLHLKLDFFTLLASISGIIGNRGQANYSAANVFMDAFAAFRHSRGQPACAIDLGVVEDAGVISEDSTLRDRFDSRSYTNINSSLLRKILYLSLLQQQENRQPSLGAQTQVITGLTVPQPRESMLWPDARFSALFTGQGGSGSAATGTNSSENEEIQALLLLLRSKSAGHAARLKMMIDLVNSCFVRMLRLTEPMDAARPLTVYGIDSLAAVELRNWVRLELGVVVTSLDIMNAASLSAFCDRIIERHADMHVRGEPSPASL